MVHHRIDRIHPRDGTARDIPHILRHRRVHHRTLRYGDHIGPCPADGLRTVLRRINHPPQISCVWKKIRWDRDEHGQADGKDRTCDDQDSKGHARLREGRKRDLDGDCGRGDTERGDRRDSLALRRNAHGQTIWSRQHERRQQGEKR